MDLQIIISLVSGFYHLFNARMSTSGFCCCFPSLLPGKKKRQLCTYHCWLQFKTSKFNSWTCSLL